MLFIYVVLNMLGTMTITRTQEFRCFLSIYIKKKKLMYLICIQFWIQYFSSRYLDTSTENNDFELKKLNNVFIREPKINTFLIWRKI